MVSLPEKASPNNNLDFESSSAPLHVSAPGPTQEDYNDKTSRTTDLEVQACREGGIAELYARAMASSISADPTEYPDDPTVFDNILDQVIAFVHKTDPKSEQYPALLYCFDCIAMRRLQFANNILDGWGDSARGEYPHPPWAQRQKALSKEGLNYFVDRTEGIHLDRTLLRTLGTEYLSTFWGQEALLEETQLSCDPDVLGNENNWDHFRVVITRLSPFIVKYPHSPVTPSLTLELARAYETWWSLANNARPDYEDAKMYKNGAEDARQKAVELYKHYLASNEDEDARNRLSLLELKRSTGHTRFYCIND